MPFVKSLYPDPPELPPLNYHTLVFEKLSNVPRDFVIQIDGLTGEKRTYGQFVERVRDCATALAAPAEKDGLGLELGRDTKNKTFIGILSPNTLDYAVLVHAAVALTLPFCCFPSNPTERELVYLLNRVKSGASHVQLRLFVHPSLLKLAIASVKEAGIPLDYISTMGGDSKPSSHTHLSSLIENVHKRRLPRHPVVLAEKNTLAFLVFSSGTSGLPKAVMVSHGNLCYSVMQAVTARTVDSQMLPLPKDAPTPVVLAFLPFYHSYALHVHVLRCPMVPQTTVVLPKWNIDQALEAIPKYHINMLLAVPSIIHQIAHSPKAAQTDFSGVLSVGSGAAYLSSDVEEKFQKVTGYSMGANDVRILQGYGLSEATVGSIIKPRGQFGLPYDPDCTGILFPGQVARIVREDGSDTDFDEPGELLIKGDNVTLGYWGDEQATKETFLPDGWLRTGDRFRVTKQGVFYFDDRAKDTLKISGAQVSPSEIESVLLSHPDKLAIDAAVAGVPSQSRSSRDEKVPRGWVVLGPRGKEIGEKAAVERLDTWVREQLSRYKWLSGGIEVVEEIPKNPTGKVLRRQLVDAFVEKEKGLRMKAKL